MIVSTWNKWALIRMSGGRDGVPALAGRKRRAWTQDEKRRIVDESLADGASIAEVARRHDLNANQVFTWRRQIGGEPVAPKELTPILPVTIVAEPAAEESDPASSGQMEIVLAEGDRIIVWADVETAALTRVLKALARR
jgi:transposase